MAFFFLSAEKCKTAKTDESNTHTSEETELVAESNTSSEAKEIGIGFYNVENLYDTANDPDRDDEDFTPDGKYHWTEDKYQIKLGNLAKVISQLGIGGTNPDIMGLVEIENETVLKDLIKQPDLKSGAYKIVHEDSKDARGVDVAFLYNPAVFTYMKHEAITPVFGYEYKKTRDFLLVEGKIGGETIHFIVNHWPSRRGGEESEKYRVDVAFQVRKVCDVIREKDKNANIVIMGDFNDDPSDKSIATTLGAKADVSKTDFYNPLAKLHDRETEGSLDYEDKWNMFDQFILSSGLSDDKGKLSYAQGSAMVFHPDWLRVGFGKAKMAPRRSIFHDQFRDDGYSDHFPVKMTLNQKKK
jgi:predicted extracellular nuclease